MAALITTLINKQDTFEIIRDQIAAILAIEVSNQMILAKAADLEPLDWKMRIFTERSNPWEQFLNNQDDKSPLVNVWYDNSNFDQKKGNTVERQNSESIFNIDVYGLGISKDEIQGGHSPGDKAAALEAHRGLRLVRNILMAGPYTYLALRGTVWQRWPQSVQVFQPSSESRTVEQVVGARLALRVSFSEFSPQVVAQTLDLLTVNINRAEDGELLVSANYDYT